MLDEGVELDCLRISARSSIEAGSTIMSLLPRRGNDLCQAQRSFNHFIGKTLARDPIKFLAVASISISLTAHVDVNGNFGLQMWAAVITYHAVQPYLDMETDEKMLQKGELP